MGSGTPTKSYVPKPPALAWTFGGRDPVMEVDPGTILQVWTEDAFGGKVRSVGDLPSEVIQPPRFNPQTGPFHVRGAEPGDTLALHFLEIRPTRPWAASCNVPFFGSLTSTPATFTLQPPLEERVWIYRVDLQRGTVEFRARDSDFRATLPMEPFHGTVGVAPARGEVRSSLVPEAFGGNMDSPELQVGTTVYLGVNVEGGLFSLGDGHLLQGEGEVCGVAVESAMDTTVAVELLKGVYTPWPRFESDDHIMVAGSGRPLEDAFRIAHGNLIKWISQDFGLSLLDAYQLVTQVVKSPIANVVDPNYTVVAKMPKAYLPRGRIMGDLHGILGELGRGVNPWGHPLAPRVEGEAAGDLPPPVRRRLRPRAGGRR